VNDFLSQDLSDCHSLIIIQKSKTGRVTLNTNMPDITLFGLVRLIMAKWDSDDEQAKHIS